MEIQARIPPALCCLHNIIREWDPQELVDIEREAGQPASTGEPDDFGAVADGIPTHAEREQMKVIRDTIAAEMWARYTAGA